MRIRPFTPRPVAVGLGIVLLAATPASAHGGSFRLGQQPPPVPGWVVLLTGAVVIGASFLFASLLTDRTVIEAIVTKRIALPTWPAAAPAATSLGAGLGLVGLTVVLVAGLAGPSDPLRNPATLLVWVVWWAGFTTAVYAVGNPWPAVNPWRTIARWLPVDGSRSRPEAIGRGPATLGLLALVFLEVVTPVGEDPLLLAVVVVGYTLCTVAGAIAVGVEPWFRAVDPIARVFRSYGAVAPLRRVGGRWQLTLPGSALTEADARSLGPTFIVALLWVTTFDGVVTTPAWTALARVVVGAGIPPLVAYLGAMLVGFGLFLLVFRVATRLARRTGSTYVTAEVIARRFAPALLPIAAGYHLAHFLGYFLSLAPAAVAALASPLAPPATPPVLTLPGWFGALELAFVLLGHILAIWVAHVVAFDLFTGRLQPIRSQYPFIVVMIGYTVTSMWIVAQPAVALPYL